MTPPPMMIERAMTPPLSLIVESKFSVFDVGVRRLRFSSHCAIFPFMPVAVPAGGGAGRRRGPRKAAARAMGAVGRAGAAGGAGAGGRATDAGGPGLRPSTGGAVVPVVRTACLARTGRSCARRAWRGRARRPRFPTAAISCRVEGPARDIAETVCGAGQQCAGLRPRHGACGMRFAACGMKHAAFGLRRVASGIRYVACGAGVDKDWRRWAVDTLLAAIGGGGSSTRVWVLSATGELLAEGRSGPSTVAVVGAEAAGRAVAEAARAAGLSAGDWPGGGANVAVVAAIMAGVETEPEYSQFLAELQRRFPDSAVVLRHDA